MASNNHRRKLCKIMMPVLLLLVLTLSRFKAAGIHASRDNKDSLRYGWRNLQESVDRYEDRDGREHLEIARGEEASREREYPAPDGRVQNESPEHIPSDTAIDHSVDKVDLGAMQYQPPQDTTPSEESPEDPKPDDRAQHETPQQIAADTSIDHSFDRVAVETMKYQPPQDNTPRTYDRDELSEEIASRSITASEINPQKRAADQTLPNNQSAWIAHALLSTLTFALLLPISISSALFRDFLPEYWIYIHVFMNVASFILVVTTVGVAFSTMNSLGEANEGHLKELHHIVGLGLLMLTAFQVGNGFLRPPREFVTEDEDDDSPGAIHSSRTKMFTPRAVWHMVHRVTGVTLFLLGTWQIRSGMAIYAKKYGGTDWGSVYLGYVGWLVFIVGGAKIVMVYRERRFGGSKGNDWNAEDELFDTQSGSGLYAPDD